MVADQVSQRHLNSDFVRVEPCSPMEDLALRQVLIRHSLLTGSPRATFFLNVGPRLPFVRIQPVQLPCTVEQTWAPILQRLHTPTLSVIHGLAVSSGRPKRGVSVPADVNVAGLADLDQAASGC